MTTTKIEWTDATWNPIRARRKDGKPNLGGGGWACQRVSDGCLHCYAGDLNRKRFGTGLDYDAKGLAASDIYLEEKVLLEPLRWRKPRKVFVCSMTDIAGEWVTDAMLDRIFAVMALCPQHVFQVLTKRPERMREYITSHDRAEIVAGVATAILDEHYNGRQRWGFLAETYITCTVAGYPFAGWPLINVWLGTSVENQREADRRIPELLATPAAVRFLSCEPLLEGLNITHIRAPDDYEYFPLVGMEAPEPRIHWVICGGESGSGARPCDIGWIRSIVQQCQAAGVACFVKQLGAKSVNSHYRLPLLDRKGGDPEEWPAGLRVREWPR